MSKGKTHHSFITFRRIIKTGCINFVRNAWLSIAAMAVMLITLTIVLFSVIANATFGNSIQQLTDKISISVYLKDSVNEEQRTKLTNDIHNLPNTKSVEYIDKEQALENFNKDNPDQLSATLQIENPLPASLKVKLDDPSKTQEISSFLEKKEIKELQSDETSYSGDTKDAVDKITSATNFFRRAGVVGVVVFAFISMMIIFNTIQMAIFNRRDEIQIMRLLGASTNYIRGPFIVESILYGVIAAIVSIVLLNALFAASSSTLQASSLGLLDINYSYEYFGKHFWLFLTSQLAIGIFIGAASSLIATRRYLKFKSTPTK